MKFSLAIVAALLAPGSLSRAVRKKAGPDVGLDQDTHISAFVINKDGQLSVECWRVDGEFRSAGSHGAVQTLASGSDIESVAIVTFDRQSQIFPPSREDMHSDDLGYYILAPGMAVVNGGTAVFNWLSSNLADTMAEDEGQFAIINTDSGNDMVFFEDQRSSQSNYTAILAKDAEEDQSPLFISSIGNSPLEMVLLMTPNLKKKKIHNGVCNHAGVNLPDDDNAVRSGGKIDLSLHIQEL